MNAQTTPPPKPAAPAPLKVRNKKLAAIAESAAADLPQFIAEAEDKLLEAWNQAEQEAQDNLTKPKFRVGFSIVLDLDADTMETKLTFGVRHVFSRSQEIPDPKQYGLKLEGGAQ